jgi:hypothetical protein
MADVTPTPEEQDANEWAEALDEFAPGHDKEETKDADTTTETTTVETTTETTTEVETTDTTTTITPDETPEQKIQREKDDAIKTPDPIAPDTRAREARQTAREAAKEVENVAKEVREKMFAEVQTELKDGDGDPIRSIEDVMKLINPQTKESFTQKEATEWLMAAQQQLNQNLAGIDKQVEQIAEVQVDMKDQADSINYQYGELLKSMPELRDQLWGEFQNTLVKDPNSGIITKMPVSLERFYEIALQPYVKLAESLEAQTAATAAAEKAAADAKKSQTRSDRSDIFGRGKVDDMDSEEKEWAAAASDYYGNK